MNEHEDNGWELSAEAWVRFMDQGDGNRELVLDPAMLRVCGNVKDQNVLDVGCGEGRFCRMLTKRGARTLGIDPTESLVEVARHRDPDGTYMIAKGEELPLDAASFDLVVSYVALVDIPGYSQAIAEMARVLRPGGRMVVSNLQAFCTSAMKGFQRDKEGNKLHLPVDNYVKERSERVAWRGIEIVNYHRPLGSYMREFLSAGLKLAAFEEPLPSAEAIEVEPRLEEYYRVPWFWLMEWRKP